MAPIDSGVGIAKDAAYFGFWCAVLLVGAAIGIAQIVLLYLIWRKL
jgi:hypothetical protein